MISELKQEFDYSDYATIPSDLQRYEMLDGELLVNPTPSPLHRVCRNGWRGNSRHTLSTGVAARYSTRHSV